MIITLPRHVAQSADLSARARIPAISRLLVSTALSLARFDEWLSTKTTRRHDLSDHLARDIGFTSGSVERRHVSQYINH